MRQLVYSTIIVCATLLFLPGCSRGADEDLFGTPLTKDADEFLTSCNIEFNSKQESLHTRWLNDQERYDVDLEKGILKLTRRSKPLVLFDVQVLGSHSHKENSWEWSWHNPNVPPQLAMASAQLKDVGKKYGLRYLQVGFVPVPMKYLGGIAMKVTDSIGLYRAEYGDLDVYLLLKNPREMAS